ncbi:MAG: BamA/TamA family outer membrane protein [Bacteroidales bacterium]
MIKYLYKISGAIIIIALLAGCNNAKRLPEGKYLLTKNKVESNTPEIEAKDVTPYIRQKPNKKILGFLRFHLTVYMLGDRIKKDNWLKKWMQESVGEAPVVLDSSLSENTARQIEYYLENRGYFDSGVEHAIELKDNRKSEVTYTINAESPYRIRELHYLAEDSLLEEIIESTGENTLLARGTVYDARLLDKERDRVSSIMKNRGYYYFNKNFIRYKVDSTLKERKVDIYLQVNDRVFELPAYDDSLLSLPHYQYTVRNVYIYPDYDALADDRDNYDTLLYEYSGKTYYYVYKGELPYKPEILNQSVFVEPGEVYRKKDVQMSNQRLSSLQQFRYVNMAFSNVYSDVRPWHRDTLPKILDCHIRLTRQTQRHYTFEWLGTNTLRDLGTEVSFTYGDRNLFRGSEIMNLKTNLSMETQQIIGSQDKKLIGDFLPFNTLEAGTNLTIELPKFLIPVSQDRFPDYFRPRTAIFAGYNYRERPDYIRHLANVSFGYQWDESETKRHQLYPLDISSIKLHPDSLFLQRLKNIDNKRFLASYQDHLIAGLKYTFILNTQQTRKKKVDFWYLRANGELAGNSLRLASILMNAEQDEEGSYRLFNIRYAQYFRMDGDLRYHYRFNEKNIFASRIAVGIGIPYGNLNVMPFERSFFVGGSNGIRAWPVRSLGPGGFQGSTNDFDKTGDFSLETSVEYRFPLYGFVNGAIFLDAGNVWLKDKNKDFPKGKFEVDKFFKQIGVGTGLGIRLDFSFFVFRVDAGVKMSDPGRPEGERWVLPDYNTNINFGIGYPF